MLTNINENQRQCKSIINANESSMQTNHQCKQSITANQHRCKPTMNGPSSSTWCVYAQMHAFTRFWQPQGGSLLSIPADLACQKKDVVDRNINTEKIIETRQVFHGFLNVRNSQIQLTVFRVFSEVCLKSLFCNFVVTINEHRLRL